jgi:hypothetical protein
MNQLQDIIADIKRENCVLIIGPDIVDFGDKTFFETMCQEFTEDAVFNNIIDTAPQYIFANDELLQLMPSAKETTLLRMMEGFYQKQTAFEIPLKMISQIPFHLVISMMPDDRLQKIFTNQNLDFSYGHYPREGAHAPIEKPNKEKPLIYNLLGDFNELDAIITFDHLFTFLSGIMGKRELPQTIQETLKKARTFLFLGVHFEKWYVQLLMRIITSKDKKDKYTILKQRQNHDACTFIARRLELDFLPTEPIKFIEELYNECGNQDILKTVKTKYKSRVFISYSSKDIAVVEKIEQRLKAAQIEVVRDENSGNAGQKIENFIDTIKTVDSVLLIVSENSLQSFWVGKEIITTIQYNKHFVPCYLDKNFIEETFWEDLKIKIKNTVDEIVQKILARSTDDSFDLEVKSNDWKEFNRNLPTIKNELNQGMAKSLMPDDFDRNILQVIQTILNKNA